MTETKKPTKGAMARNRKAMKVARVWMHALGHRPKKADEYPSDDLIMVACIRCGSHMGFLNGKQTTHSMLMKCDVDEAFFDETLPLPIIGDATYEASKEEA